MHLINKNDELYNQCLVCLRTTGQNMESESETESEWDPESSTDSHSENDREKKGRGGERKTRKKTCKQTGPSPYVHPTRAKSKTPLSFPKCITLQKHL